jgi:hypothetical protein
MTNLPAIHLSEEERQRTADGTLDAADRARVDHTCMPMTARPTLRA